MPKATEKEVPKSPFKSDVLNGFDVFFPKNFGQIHIGNTAALMQANDIILRTARSVWESQTELFRLETERARDSFRPLKTGESPIQALPGALEQWHRSTERAVTHMRAISDAMRECEWQLMTIAAQNMAPSQPKAAE